MRNKFEKLVEIMQLLRDPQSGCPWDRQQTFKSIAPYTLEEAYEVVDAIENDDMTALLSELGDLLLQVVYHAQMASEQGLFDVSDVLNAIIDKLIRRHPHIFGESSLESVTAIKAVWEDQKIAERQSLTQDKSVSILGDITASLPALTRALKIQQRVAHVGFDWENINPIYDKVLEELDEVKHEVEMKANPENIEEEIGDLYFSVTNLARHLQVNPELALRKANSKFVLRFSRIEALLAEQGKTVDKTNAGELNALWEQVKTSA